MYLYDIESLTRDKKTSYTYEQLMAHKDYNAAAFQKFAKDYASVTDVDAVIIADHMYVCSYVVRMFGISLCKKLFKKLHSIIIFFNYV